MRARRAEDQLAAALAMIRPRAFGPNPETAATNAFQRAWESFDPARAEEVRSAARSEFDAFAELLEAGGADVIVFEDRDPPRTTDAVFPNNWVSTHADGTVVLYPMQAPSRRAEVRLDVVLELERRFGFPRSSRVDLTSEARGGRFLEGTGSLVLDRVHRIAYACLSPRTHPDLAAGLARALGYELHGFRATDASGLPVYHTNVALSVGTDFAVVCLEAVAPEQREPLRRRLEETGHDVVELRGAQMASFAGNVLQVRTAAGAPLVVLSRAALAALDPAQRRRLERSGELLTPELGTIERHGGGSARCMLLEVFPPD